MTWERFCNWLESKPWTWRYDRIYRSLRAGLTRWESVKAALAFPHVHRDPEPVGPPEFSDRGFARWPEIPSEHAGDPDVDSYDTLLRIYESSAAMEPCLWVAAEGRGHRDYVEGGHSGDEVHRSALGNTEILAGVSVGVHLTRRGVERARDQLTSWLQYVDS